MRDSAEASGIDIDALWHALKLEAGATPPSDPKFDEVKRLVMVSKAHLRAALQRVK